MRSFSIEMGYLYIFDEVQQTMIFILLTIFNLYIFLIMTIQRNLEGLLQILGYRSGTVNSKSFVSKVLLRIKWKFELN